MLENTINDDKTIAGGIGTMLAGRYNILRQLGEGGMGSVWLAEDRQLDNRKVAIKMLPSIVVTDKRAYQQLKSEALVSLKLVHPNIVTLRAFEENNGAPFLVMDYIEGQTLSDYLAVKGKLSEAETIKLLKPIAAALDYAHGEKVIHRDVKPSNIIIRKDGHPFILDFGIAREIQESMTRVTGRTISGTLLYMSPEQLRGAPPAPAQDVYSFAAMVYECLKGETPFIRGDIAHQILYVKPIMLVGRKQLVISVMAGLAKQPMYRPKCCLAVLGYNSTAPIKVFSIGSSFKKLSKKLHIFNGRKTSLVMGCIALAAVVVLLCLGFLSALTKQRTRQFLELVNVEKFNAAAELIGKVDASEAHVQCALGEMYFKGNGLEKDEFEAVKWYRKAAEQGHTKSQFHLGNCYVNGDGIERDEKIAITWFRKAAWRGDADAQNALGIMYQDGRGVTKNEFEAAKWFRKAAEQGNADAQNSIAEMYASGSGVVKNYEEAIKWYRKAAEQGHVKAQEQLGLSYFVGANGVEMDWIEAKKWVRKAAEQGSAESQCTLGALINMVDKDKTEAVKWYRKAAAQGHATAQANLGYCYERGEGVTKNEEESIKWYRKAARQGDWSAQETLREKGLSW